MRYPLAPVVVTPPAETPVSVAEAKAQCRVEGADDDALITSLIAAATSHLDGWSGVLGRCLITQTLRQDFACFPAAKFLRLPLAPVTSVTVKYFDENNAEQTLAAAAYEGPFSDSLGPYIALKPDQSWPSTFDREDAVRVTFIAGYGAAADVPPEAKHAILLLVGHWYENREAVVTGTISTEIQKTFDALIASLRRVGF